MRTHKAGQQATTLEKVVAKLLTRLGFDQDGDGEAVDVMQAVGDALLEAYALGAVEAVDTIPLEGAEVIYRTRPTPALLGLMLRQGWKPWAISDTSWQAFEDEPDKPLPKGWKKAPGEPARKRINYTGWVVRFTRRVPPAAQDAQPEAAKS